MKKLMWNAKQSLQSWIVTLTTINIVLNILLCTLPSIYALQTDLNSITVEVTDTSAAISWRTDLSSQGSVEVGTSLDQLRAIPETSAERTEHRVVIETLNPNTLYYYRIKSFTATEEHSTTFRSFRTLLPRPTGLRAEQIAHNSARIAWDLNSAASSYNVYLNSQLKSRSRTNIYTLTNLTPATRYSVQVTAIDTLNRESPYSEALEFTTQEAPPTISFVAATEITNTSAAITWRTSNEAIGRVKYSKTLALENSVDEERPATNHRIVLTGLTSDTRYFFKVVVGSAESPQHEFRTLNNNAAAFEITDVAVAAVTSRTATISWKTNIETASKVVYSTDDSFNLEKYNSIRTKEHSLTLENLQAGTKYYYKIVADAKTSEVLEFTTSDAESDFLNIEPLPELTNKIMINVSGRTRPNSRLYISVNGEYQIRKTLNSTEFNERIRLTQTAHYNDTIGRNLVKIEAWDSRGNKDTFTTYIVLDNVPPRFELNSIPLITNAAALNISGKSEPNVSVEVFFNNVSVAKFMVENETFFHSIPTHASANYSMRIVAKDKAENVVQFEYELIIDKAAPLLELNQMPKETHFKLFRVEGKTEPNAYVSVVNFGEFEGCQDAAFLKQYGECTEFDDKTKAEGTKLHTEVALDPFTALYGTIHTTQANEEGYFSIIISLIPGKQGRGGENKLRFYVADEAGNVNQNTRAVIQYTPGCPEWHISNVESMPFNIYTEELHERDIPASIFYTLDYIGQGVPEITQLMVREDESGASLIKPAGSMEVGANVFLQRGVNNTNELVTVNEQTIKFSRYDPETNKVYVYVPLLINRYYGSAKDLPDQIGVFLRNYIVYTIDKTSTAQCSLYPVASFDVQKPENILKWLSPEQLNKTIEKLEQIIKGTRKVVDYTTTAARVTLIGCGAGLALKYMTGFVEKQQGCDTSLKWIFEMCDRVLCPKVPENCNEFEIFDGSLQIGKDKQNAIQNLDLQARDKIRNQMSVNDRYREAYSSEYNTWLKQNPGGSFANFIASRHDEKKYTEIRAKYNGDYQEFSHPAVYRTQRGEDEVIEIEYRDLTQQPFTEQIIGGRLYRCPRNSKTMILHTSFSKNDEQLFGESTVRGYDVDCDSRSTGELGPPRVDQIPGCYTEGCDAKDNPKFDETKCLFGAGYGLNPPEDLWSSVKCGCLPGIRGHLMNWVKIMTAIKGCLQQAQIGEMRGGFCERLAAQFACDIFIQMFKFIIHTADRPGEGAGVGGLKEGIENYKYNSQRIGEALEDRYGGILKERLKLTSDDLINKACVAAITLDWSLLDGLLDNIIESIDVPPVVAVYGTTRPYGYDPFSGRFSIGYNVYVGIVPGGDTNVRAYMICDRNKEGGEYCGRGISRYPITQVPEFLTKNDLFNENIIFVDDNAKYWYNVVCVDTEYKIGDEIKRETNCDTIKRRGDLSLLNCRFDVLAGIQCRALEQVGGPLGKIGVVQLYNEEAGSKKTTPQVQMFYNGNTVSALIKMKNSFKEDFYLRVNNGLQMFEYRIIGKPGVPGEEGLTGFGEEQTYLVAMEGVGTGEQVQSQIPRRFAAYNPVHDPRNAIQLTTTGTFAVQPPSELSRATLAVEYTGAQSQTQVAGQAGQQSLERGTISCDIERDIATGSYKRMYGVNMPQRFVEIRDPSLTSAASTGILWEEFCRDYSALAKDNPLLAADCSLPWEQIKQKYLRVEEGYYKCLIPNDLLYNNIPASRLQYVQSVDITQYNFVNAQNIDFEKAYIFPLKYSIRSNIPFTFAYGTQQYQQYGGSTRQARINVLADLNKNGQGDTEITFTEAGGIARSQEFSLGYQVQNAPANGMTGPEVEIVEPLMEYSTGIRNGHFNNDNRPIPLGFVIWDDDNNVNKIMVRIRNLNPRNSYECTNEMTYDAKSNTVTPQAATATTTDRICNLKINDKRFIGFKAGWPGFFALWFEPSGLMTRTQDDFYALAVQVEDTKNLKGMDTARFSFDQRGTLTAEDVMVCLGGGLCSGSYEPPNRQIFEVPGMIQQPVRIQPAESYRYEPFVGGRSPYEEEAVQMQKEKERSSLAVRLMAEQGIKYPPSGFSVTVLGNVKNFEGNGVDTRSGHVVFMYKTTDNAWNIIINPLTGKVEDPPTEISQYVTLIEEEFNAVYKKTPSINN